MRTYEAGRDVLFTGVVMQHSGGWHDFAVYRVKGGLVTWRCRICGKVDKKQVRVYGTLPAELLFVRRRHWLPPLRSLSAVLSAAPS